MLDIFNVGNTELLVVQRVYSYNIHSMMEFITVISCILILCRTFGTCFSYVWISRK